MGGKQESQKLHTFMLGAAQSERVFDTDMSETGLTK